MKPKHAGAGEDSRAPAPQNAIPQHNGDKPGYHSFSERVTSSAAFKMLKGSHRWILIEAIRLSGIAASRDEEWFVFPAGAGIAPLSDETHHAAMREIVRLGFFKSHLPYKGAALQYSKSGDWEYESLDEGTAKKIAKRAERLAKDHERKRQKRALPTNKDARSQEKPATKQSGRSQEKPATRSQEKPCDLRGLRKGTYCINQEQPHPTSPMTQAEARALAVETIKAYDAWETEKSIEIVMGGIAGLDIEEAKARLNAALSEAVPLGHPEFERRGLYALLQRESRTPAPKSTEADPPKVQTVEETAPSVDESASAPPPDTEPDPDDPVMDQDEDYETTPHGAFDDQDSQYEHKPHTTPDDAPKRSPEPIRSIKCDSERSKPENVQPAPSWRQTSTASKPAPHVDTGFIPSREYVDLMRGG